MRCQYEDTGIEDEPQQCENEAVYGNDLCAEHLREEQDFDNALKRLKEDRL